MIKNNFFLTIFLCFAMPGFSSVPEICRVQGGHTRTIWGTGFFEGVTEVYSANMPFNEREVVTALESGDYKGKQALPSVPPANSRRLNILTQDPRGLVMAVEFSDDYTSNGFFGDRVGDDVVWVKNGDGYSKPWLVKSADTWFIYPEKANAGELVRVFGRCVDARLIAVRKQGERKLTLLKGGDVAARNAAHVHNSLYEAEVRLPRDIEAGEYELFVHNGSGGTAGWSEPLKFWITPKAKRPTYYEAKDYGVKSNGYTDDTEALRRALGAAATTGGTVMLQPGVTIISETIELPDGVSLRGGGEGATSLQTLDENPLHGGFPKAAVLEDYARDWATLMEDYTPMFWMRNNSGIANLSLVYGAGVDFGILIARCPGVSENIHVERIKVIANRQTDAWHTSYALLIMGNTYGLSIADCDFKGWGSVGVIANDHHQAYIARNKMVTFPTGIANTFFIRGFNESVIESNEAYYGIRNFVLQDGRKYGKHNNPSKLYDLDRNSTHIAMLGNVFINNLARRHNDGELMIEAGFAQWWGPVVHADKNSITVAGEPFDVDMSDNRVIILDGKGIGQYRKIISSTKNKLIFDKEWDVVPDLTTVVSVGGFNVEHLWIDNTSDNNASWTGFWGNNVGHVVDGHIMRDGAPFYLWGWAPDRPATVAFIDLIGVRSIGGGGVGILGAPVFGNTIRYCEFIDFRYYPTFHIQPSWLNRRGDPSGTFAISFNGTHTFNNIPATAPLNGWNLFEANHIADGSNGIHIPSFADYTILKRNVIHVDKEPYVNESKTTVVKER